MNYLETACITGQNDCQTKILSRQIVILAGHCLVTSCYFEPCNVTPVLIPCILLPPFAQKALKSAVILGQSDSNASWDLPLVARVALYHSWGLFWFAKIALVWPSLKCQFALGTFCYPGKKIIVGYGTRRRTRNEAIQFRTKKKIAIFSKIVFCIKSQNIWLMCKSVNKKCNGAMVTCNQFVLLN